MIVSHCGQIMYTARPAKRVEYGPLSVGGCSQSQLALGHFICAPRIEGLATAVGHADHIAMHSRLIVTNNRSVPAQSGVYLQMFCAAEASLTRARNAVADLLRRLN